MLAVSNDWPKTGVADPDECKYVVVDGWRCIKFNSSSFNNVELADDNGKLINWFEYKQLFLNNGSKLLDLPVLLKLLVFKMLSAELSTSDEEESVEFVAFVELDVVAASTEFDENEDDEIVDSLYNKKFLINVIFYKKNFLTWLSVSLISDTIPDDEVGESAKLLSAKTVNCNFKEGKYGGIISEPSKKRLLLLFFKYNLFGWISGWTESKVLLIVWLFWFI